MYAVWDTVGQLGWNIGSGIFAEFHVLDDTVLRKVNESDASQFARICGCFPSQGKSHILHNRGCPITQVFFFFCFFCLVWGVIWFFVAVIFFALGVLVGLAVFKVSLWFFLFYITSFFSKQEFTRLSGE